MTSSDFDIITFDCYGTLIDWEGGIINAFQSEAAKDGLTLEGDQIIAAYSAEEPKVESGAYLSYREMLRETARLVGSRLGWNVSTERASFLAQSLAEWKPFADTNAALERLAGKFQLGILSNVDDDLLAGTMRQFTVQFDLIVTAQQVRSYKPGLAHFNEAITRLSARRLLHAAQSYFHDVIPCAALRIPTVWVNRKGERPDPGGPSPTHEVRNLSELADFLGA